MEGKVIDEIAGWEQEVCVTEWENTSTFCHNKGYPRFILLIDPALSKKCFQNNMKQSMAQFSLSYSHLCSHSLNTVGNRENRGCSCVSTVFDRTLLHFYIAVNSETE